MRQDRGGVRQDRGSSEQGWQKQELGDGEVSARALQGVGDESIISDRHHFGEQ
jgi:hypothetical protein